MRLRQWGAIAAAILIASPQGVWAEDATPAAPAAPASAPAAPPTDQLLTQGQLDALVAPIALFPDDLLAQVLMASTYPLEVIEADRWAQANQALKGEALKAAVDKQSWDDSVKSLVATPSVLHMMSDKLGWMQQLGDAVLAQMPDVMDAVQRLRVKAQLNNKLASNPQQTVTTQTQGERQVIVIQPAQPDTIFVPYYDPGVVFGAWPYPAYPPFFWPAPGYIAGGLIATGIAFGTGYALGRWTSGGYWGGGVNWGGRNINVNRNFVNNGNININRGNIGSGNVWQHNPVHRQGVRYNNTNVANKFGGGNNINIGNSQNRADFRGRGGDQVLKPGAGVGNGSNIGGANRPNLGGGNGANIGGANRPNVGGGQNRPNIGGGAGNAGANRPNVGGGQNRPNVGGGQNRPNVGGGQNRPNGGATRPNVTRPAPGGGASQRPAMGGGNNRGGAFNAGSGRAANFEGSRGRASVGGGGGGGMRGGGGGGRGGGGGGVRRSDIKLKRDIMLLGRLDDGLNYYRFVYKGGHTAYVGVMAQEVQAVAPSAVLRGADGYLRVDYDQLGVPFETYDRWLAEGARLPKVWTLAP